MSDNDRSILITGCSSGLGYDAAHALSREGWRVLATCRKEEDCARLRDEGLESYQIDLASDQSVADGAAEALRRTDGRLFALYNNGAYAIPGCVDDLPRDALRAIFDTNVFAQFDLARRVMPAMRAAGRGRIIMNSSVLGFSVMRYRGAYAASKYAMEALTDAMRMEHRDQPIEIVLIEPGPIPSRIRVNSRPHFRKWIDVAASAHRKDYENTLIPTLFDQDNATTPFDLPPSANTRALRRALTDRRPKPRYFVTAVPWIIWGMRRVLTTRPLDALLRRI